MNYLTISISNFKKQNRYRCWVVGTEFDNQVPPRIVHSAPDILTRVKGWTVGKGKKLIFSAEFSRARP